MVERGRDSATGRSGSGAEAGASVRLLALAHGRSGDKGDLVNIGVIARREEWFDSLFREISPERVARWLEPLGIGAVERYELPNLGALNFLVRDALGGGGSMNLRVDAQGKTFAQALLRMPMELSPDLAEAVRAHWGGALPDYCAPTTAPESPNPGSTNPGFANPGSRSGALDANREEEG